MKKLLLSVLLLLAIACTLSACGRTKEPVITVEDGFVTVNGVKTEYEVNTPDKITVEGGYLVVNGVKTPYKVEVECEHKWQTVTTAPTCTEEGHDLMTCIYCNKTVRANVTEAKGHSYPATYSADDDYHWLTCTACGEIKDKATHTLDDEGVCTVCQRPIASTPGIVYDVSADGTYAEVIGYNGTASKVRIAEEYNGLPVKSIYNRAFYPNKTITSVVIPNSVTSIGVNAFAYCPNLTSVVIGNSVTSIGDYAFYCCSKLASVVIPDSVTSIGSGAFAGCFSLTSVVIPNSVTSIDSGVFSSCSNLTSVVIPNSVTSIGNSAFASCSNLTSVVIPDSVTSIGSGAFDACSDLKTVYYTGSAEQWSKISIGSSNTNLTSAKIHSNYTPPEE